MNLLRENSVLTHYGRPPTATNGVVSGKEDNGSILNWVDWEIKKAVELKKKIVAVQVEKNTTTPKALYGVGTRGP